MSTAARTLASATVGQSDPITVTRELPSGARFLRCALQVNPFEYLATHGKQTAFTNADEYNTAIVATCLRLNISVIAVTDHYRVKTASTLIARAQEAGIHAFPGFEAVTKDGVHLLCLFNPGADLNSLERILGDCGIHEDHGGSPIGKYDTLEFLSESRKWRAICIAAHVASEGGLLRKLSGQSRIRAWRTNELLACSLPGPVDDAPDEIRPIIANTNPDYRRDRPIAVLNAQDVSDPSQLETPGATCWIKMSEVSVEGLRQAFLDPESRIRLHGDPVPDEHSELVALTWEGGFLDGVGIHFNSNLNVLVGGRGTGKSTVVESLRYVLGLSPIGDEARKAHEGIVGHVLRGGTKVSLVVQLCRPATREYRIERTIPNPPVVRDDSGHVSTLQPSELFPRVEVYGQHEISELTKSREKLTRLLDRFVEHDESLGQRKAALRRELDKTRRALLDVRAELQQVNERLAALPALEETLKRFHEAGLEERLKDQSLLVREERILNSIPDRLQPLRACLDNLRRELPIDRTFLSLKALDDLPGKDIIADTNQVLERLSQEVTEITRNLELALQRATDGVAEVRRRWEERKQVVQTAYERILRELQKSAVDATEFIRLRRQVEDLRPLRERQELLRRAEKEHFEQRRMLLAEWEDLKAKDFRLLDRAARKVSRKLRDRVQVEVTSAGDREPLFRLLRDDIGGRLSETIDALSRVKDFSLPLFVESCRSGVDALQKAFGVTPTQADRLAKAPPEVLLRIEEVELPSTTVVRLNTAPQGEPPVWQALEELSTGQKATAVLLLLLLESDAPLIVDQPEDDLDNRFITEGVVPRMREEKRRRQFIFSTHNANIPVLGDAELILGLSATGEGEQGRARIAPEHMGSIDSQTVRELVEEILEGGKTAFEMRRLKYGF
ncbi:MAG: TrlF family AAA-like ATPase [Candidatus Eiseniibacteriota bacterium]